MTSMLQRYYENTKFALKKGKPEQIFLRVH